MEFKDLLEQKMDLTDTCMWLGDWILKIDLYFFLSMWNYD